MMLSCVLLFHAKDDAGTQDVKRTLYDKNITGDSELRPISDWKWRKVASLSDIPGYGTVKKIGQKIFEALKAADIELQVGIRLMQQQVPYDEYSYEVYLDGTTFEPVTHRFNEEYKGSGWDGVGPIRTETTNRICIGAGALCTK